MLRTGALLSRLCFLGELMLTFCFIVMTSREGGLPEVIIVVVVETGVLTVDMLEGTDQELLITMVQLARVITVTIRAKYLGV